MKAILLIVGFIAVLVLAAWTYLSPSESDRSPRYLPALNVAEEKDGSSDQTTNVPRVSVIAESLNVPWEVLFLPDGEILVTERTGQLVLLKQGVKIPVLDIESVGEGGLLGAAFHPDFVENSLLYLYETTQADEGLKNRVVRYKLEGAELNLDKVIIDDLPGARYHDGGRMAFGSDGHLYITVGDAGNEEAAQDPEHLAGSILRLTAEGEIPSDNPFANAVYSYGHRNPQGLAWDDSGRLWSTEHGRSGLASGFDEVNLIESGNNYGWPDSQGDSTKSGTVAPIIHSGARTTWAPASAVYLEGSLYFAGLRGQTLYEAVLNGSEVVELREHLVGEYGRLRTVTVGPDGLLYLTTSNSDGRGSPSVTDDRLIRVDPTQL